MVRRSGTGKSRRKGGENGANGSRGPLVGRNRTLVDVAKGPPGRGAGMGASSSMLDHASGLEKGKAARPRKASGRHPPEPGCQDQAIGWWYEPPPGANGVGCRLSPRRTAVAGALPPRSDVIEFRARAGPARAILPDPLQVPR